MECRRPATTVGGDGNATTHAVSDTCHRIVDPGREARQLPTRLEAPRGNASVVRKEGAHEAGVRPVGRHLDVGDGADRKKHEAVGAHQLEVYVYHAASGGTRWKRN